MDPSVFFRVCYQPDGTRFSLTAARNRHQFLAATLADYCRHRVKGAPYPGIIPEKGQSVRGIYATGLTDEHMQRLDRFEGSEYDRVTVKVKLIGEGNEADGVEKETSVYVFNQPDDVERGEWDFEHFCKVALPQWMRNDIFFDG